MESVAAQANDTNPIKKLEVCRKLYAQIKQNNLGTHS
jgi:head-tail adaptor